MGRTKAGGGAWFAHPCPRTQEVFCDCPDEVPKCQCRKYSRDQASRPLNLQREMLGITESTLVCSGTHSSRRWCGDWSRDSGPRETRAGSACVAPSPRLASQGCKSSFPHTGTLRASPWGPQPVETKHKTGTKKRNVTPNSGRCPSRGLANSLCCPDTQIWSEHLRNVMATAV